VISKPPALRSHRELRSAVEGVLADFATPVDSKVCGLPLFAYRHQHRARTVNGATARTPLRSVSPCAPFAACNKAAADEPVPATIDGPATRC